MTPPRAQHENQKDSFRLQKVVKNLSNYDF